jgi:hypothetical protein
MKIKLGDWFVRLGPGPNQDNNFVSIDRAPENSLIRVSACAEGYDSSLGFYTEVCGLLCRNAEGCWFELQRPTRNKIPEQIDRGASFVGYSNAGGLYAVTASHRIVSLVSEFWLSDRFRILGTGSVSSVAAVELVNGIHARLQDVTEALAPSVAFVLEKQYFADESSLAVLVRNSKVDLAYDIVVRSASRLKRPLVQVGHDAWPPLA